jgi:hypothetical protein
MTEDEEDLEVEDLEYPEELQPVLELSDSIYELLEKLERIREKVDTYEQEYLDADLDTRESIELPSATSIERWNNFVYNAILQIDVLSDPL